MSLNLVDISNLDERIVEYQSSMDSRQTKGASLTRLIAQRISQEIGEEVLLPLQIPALAYILGFEAPSPNTGLPYYPNSELIYNNKLSRREIESMIPSTGRIDIAHLVKALLLKVR